MVLRALLFGVEMIPPLSEAGRTVPHVEGFRGTAPLAAVPLGHQPPHLTPLQRENRPPGCSPAEAIEGGGEEEERRLWRRDG